MTSFEGEIRIEAPVERVWSLLVDHDATSRWVPDVREVEVLTEERGVGCRRRVVLGRMELEHEVTACDPEARRFVYRAGPTGPIAEAISIWTLHADGEGTRVVNTAELSFRFPLIGLLVGAKLRGTQRRALEGLKAALEEA